MDQQPRIKARFGIQVQRSMADLGSASHGPTLVVLAGIHGNEEGGVLASQRLVERIERRRIKPRGRVVVLAGNLRALMRGMRFVDHDLNRLWKDPQPEGISEKEEYHELNAAIERLAAEAHGPLTVIDLHSFSGKGHPFLIAPNKGCHRALVENVPFPVINGLNDLVLGTFCGHLEKLGHYTLAIEGGRDADPEVPVNMEAFLWMGLARLGLIDESEIPPSALKTWRRLFQDRIGLPDALWVHHRHAITPEDGFAMVEGYRTFDKVAAGTLLATDARGEVQAPMDGWLLMPLYQGQGEDGFFIGTDRPDRPGKNLAAVAEEERVLIS